MPQRLVLSTLTLSLAAAFGAGQAWALGFGRAQPSVAMGSPLDFVVGVRLDNGELLTTDCVSADVWIGDNAVPRSGVGAFVDSSSGAPAIRVRTLNRIDEPVVTIHISAGCEGKISRRFTIFADPPGSTTALPAVVLPEPVAEVPATPTVAPPAPRAVAAITPEVPRGRLASRAPAEPPSDQALPAPPAVSRAAAPAKRASAGSDTLRLGKASVALAANGSGARLRLDAPSVTIAADQAAVEAAERRTTELAAVRTAVDLAQAAASSASTRVASMEASLESLKKESRVNRETMTRLQQALSEADERGRWTPWLLGTVLALLGVAGWLYARLRRVETDKQQAWWNSAHSAEAPGVTEVPARGAAAEAAIPPAPAVAAEPPPIPVAPSTVLDTPVPPTQSTQPMPAGLVVPDSPLRDVSIEELLDVEQQAEFFVVLGQDEAAIDLLVGHLRSTGGASPLPYLKLLEIYHRCGDQPSYDRMRRRFNERFNAVAPDWSTGLQAGRALEDYPDVVAQIQGSWSRPLDAMADLETLLFRTSGGDMFDLPAYRDVLFLFTLARDLQEMAQHDATGVDVLLPLSHPAGGERGSRSGERSLAPETDAHVAVAEAPKAS